MKAIHIQAICAKRYRKRRRERRGSLTPAVRKQIWANAIRHNTTLGKEMIRVLRRRLGTNRKRRSKPNRRRAA